jgi:hypothetical protein
MLRHRHDVPWRVLIRGAGVPGAARAVPKPGDSSELESVFCTAFVNCWAVGDYDSGTATLNQALHWNGKKWTQVATPNPAGTTGAASNELFGVRCVKPTDCWAVGHRQKGTGPDFNVALHWNGKTWAKVSTPTPGGTLPGDFNELFELFCTSSTNCWSVGDYGTQTGLTATVILTQALHWNGKAWTQVHTPNPGGTANAHGSGLSSVRCSSASDCWADGTYGTVGIDEHLSNLAVHWNGKKWTQVHTPNPAGTSDGHINELFGLSCTSATNCWATGTEGTVTGSFTLLNEALHWNGKKWFRVTTPDPDGTTSTADNTLNSVSCTNTSNCWAVGSYGISGGDGARNQALHWNGKKWSKATTPNPAGSAADDLNDLFGVRCTSTTHCWAVGRAQKGTDPGFNEALKLNGTKWTASAPVAVAGHVSAGTVAKALFRSHNEPWPVLLRSAGLAGVSRRVPKPADFSRLNGVYCTAFVNCWAVGDTGKDGGAEVNQILHWTGKKWTEASVPSPGGTGSGDFSELFAVRCSKPSDCWAVGERRKGSGPTLDVALHWNGKKWIQVPTPAPGGTGSDDFSNLFEVTCASSSNCWAVGEYGNGDAVGGEVVLNQALHWNGKAWRQVHTPNPAGTSDNDGNGLDSVRCTSASNCWAVGLYGSIGASERLHNLALHWNGKKWATVTTPNPGGTGKGAVNELNGLSCTAASNCWADGVYGSLAPGAFVSLTLALHWNGKKWAKVTTPNPDGTGNMAMNSLAAVSCTNATNCWAVGSYGSADASTGAALNLALRWNGKKWAKVTAANPGGTSGGAVNQLTGVRCTSTVHCWAVGQAIKAGSLSVFNQALRWNGTKWSST